MLCIHLDAPWLSDHCNVINNEYLPVRDLALMIDRDRRTVKIALEGYLTFKVPDGRAMRNFIELGQLRECLRIVTKWSEETIEEAALQLEQGGVSPPRKSYDDPKRMRESDDEVLPQPAKRKYRSEEEVPQWAEAFVADMTALVGRQAIEVYTGTEQFVEDCAKAVQERVGRLEKELRKQVEQDLRKQLAPRVEARLKEEMQAASLKRFELQAAQSVFKAPSEPKRHFTDSDILDRARDF